jgi:hypothetical protein
MAYSEVLSWVFVWKDWGKSRRHVVLPVTGIKSEHETSKIRSCNNIHWTATLRLQRIVKKPTVNVAQSLTSLAMSWTAAGRLLTGTEALLRAPPRHIYTTIIDCLTHSINCVGYTLSDGWMIVNNELEMMWKKTSRGLFEVCIHLYEGWGTGRKDIILSQSGHSPAKIWTQNLA